MVSAKYLFQILPDKGHVSRPKLFPGTLWSKQSFIHSAPGHCAVSPRAFGSWMESLGEPQLSSCQDSVCVSLWWGASTGNSVTSSGALHRSDRSSGLGTRSECWKVSTKLVGSTPSLVRWVSSFRRYVDHSPQRHSHSLPSAFVMPGGFAWV